MKIKISELKRLISEAVGSSSAMEDLKRYAASMGLSIVTNRKTIADMCDCDVADMPPIKAAALWNDEHSHYIAAAVTNKGLVRFGNEEILDEDPGEIIPTSLEELMSLGDPKTGYGPTGF